MATETAEALLDIEAVKLQPGDLFTWASGWKSPVYCDNRRTLSYPEVRKLLKNGFTELISQHYAQTEVIAGVATAGIPHGALVADALDLPFVYVRNKAKQHGLQNKIEGHLIPGQKAVVVEDLISTGKSSLAAVAALRAVKAEVLGLTAVFTYGFEVASTAFQEARCPFFALSDYTHLIAIAERKNIVSAYDMELLESWRVNPKGFGQ